MDIKVLTGMIGQQAKLLLTYSYISYICTSIHILLNRYYKRCAELILDIDLHRPKKFKFFSFNIKLNNIKVGQLKKQENQ